MKSAAASVGGATSPSTRSIVSVAPRSCSQSQRYWRTRSIRASGCDVIQLPSWRSGEIHISTVPSAATSRSASVHSANTPYLPRCMSPSTSEKSAARTPATLPVTPIGRGRDRSARACRRCRDSARPTAPTVPRSGGTTDARCPSARAHPAEPSPVGGRGARGRSPVPPPTAERARRPAARRRRPSDRRSSPGTRDTDVAVTHHVIFADRPDESRRRRTHPVRLAIVLTSSERTPAAGEWSSCRHRAARWRCCPSTRPASPSAERTSARRDRRPDSRPPAWRSRRHS